MLALNQDQQLPLEPSLGQNATVTRPLTRQDEEQDYENLHCLTTNSLAVVTDSQKQGSTHGMTQFKKQTVSLLLLPSSSTAGFPITNSLIWEGCKAFTALLASSGPRRKSCWSHETSGCSKDFAKTVELYPWRPVITLIAAALCAFIYYSVMHSVL